jgi:hypothetical protein
VNARGWSGSLVASLLLSAAFAGKQAPDARSDSERREIEFARGLAEEWGFAELAQQVVDGLAAKAETPRQQAELELLRCELLAASARRAGPRRDELARRSIESYRAFADRTANDAALADLARAAQLALVREATARASELALELEDDADSEAIRGELSACANDTLRRSGALIDELRRATGAQRSDADTRQVHELLLAQGDLALDLARAQPDPAAALAKARTAFDRVLETAAETSPFALRAKSGLAEIDRRLGRLEPAARAFQMVVELAVPRDAAAWSAARAQMSPAELEMRFAFVQLATAGLVDALDEAGKEPEAVAWGLSFVNLWRLEQLELQRPVGDLSLLAVARALLGVGGYVGGDWLAGRGEWLATTQEHVHAKSEPTRALDVALALAKVVEDRNRGMVLGDRARNLIDDVLARPGVEFKPDVLLESGQVAFAAGVIPRATERLERALAALEHSEPAEQQRLGAKVLGLLGRCQQSEGRPLEAVRSFETALERFAGDTEEDRLNARALYESVRALRGERQGDPQIEQLAQRAEELAAKHDPRLGGELAFARAEQAFAAARYEEAAEVFAAVPAHAREFEQARAFAGACAVHLGQLERAESILGDYLDRYLQDPANALASSDGEQRGRRAEAQAIAVFHRGWCACELAERGAGAPQWKRAAVLLDGFETRFPAQSSYAPAALYRALVAYERLGRAADSRRVLATLIQRFPADPWTATALGETYRGLEHQLEQTSDASAKRALVREMAETLRALNGATETPAYANLALEADRWLELEEWDAAERVLARIVEQFGSTRSDDVANDVLPKLGEARLRLGDARGAAEALAPLVEGGAAARRTVQTYARALAGWVEAIPPTDGGGALRITAHPGAGGAEGARKALQLLDQLTASAEPWSAEWLECEFDRLQAQLVLAESDPATREALRGELGLLASEIHLGPRFEHPNLSEALRQKFLWLRDRVTGPH